MSLLASGLRGNATASSYLGSSALVASPFLVLGRGWGWPILEFGAAKITTSANNNVAATAKRSEGRPMSRTSRQSPSGIVPQPLLRLKPYSTLAQPLQTARPHFHDKDFRQPVPPKVTIARSPIITTYRSSNT